MKKKQQDNNYNCTVLQNQNVQVRHYQQNNIQTKYQTPTYCNINYPVNQKPDKSKYIWSSVKWVGGFFLLYLAILIFIVFVLAFEFGAISAMVEFPLETVILVFENENFIQSIIAMTASLLLFSYISYTLLYKQLMTGEKIYKKPEINRLVTSSGLTFFISLFVRLFAIFSTYFLLMLVKDYASTNELLDAVFAEKQNYLPSIISSVLCAPIYEEIVFRYGLQKNLDKICPNTSVLVTSLIFSAAHLNPAGFVPILIISLCMGHVYKKTDNLLYPTLMHMAFNVTAILAQYTSFVMFQNVF